MCACINIYIYMQVAKNLDLFYIYHCQKFSKFSNLFYIFPKICSLRRFLQFLFANHCREFWNLAIHEINITTAAYFQYRIFLLPLQSHIYFLFLGEFLLRRNYLCSALCAIGARRISSAATEEVRVCACGVVTAYLSLPDARCSWRLRNISNPDVCSTCLAFAPSLLSSRFCCKNLG